MAPLVGADAVADTHQHHDGGDANDDAEHRQQPAGTMGVEVVHGRAKRLTERHGACPTCVRGGRQYCKLGEISGLRKATFARRYISGGGLAQSRHRPGLLTGRRVER